MSPSPIGPGGHLIEHQAEIRVYVISPAVERHEVIVEDYYFTMRPIVAYEGAEGPLFVDHKGKTLPSPAVIRAGVEALRALAKLWEKLADEMGPPQVRARTGHEVLQAINFSYGQLASSTNHKPDRDAFAKLAASLGWSDAEFEAWAAEKKWAVKEAPKECPDTSSTAPIVIGYLGAGQRGPYETRQRRDGDYDVRFVSEPLVGAGWTTVGPAWEICPASYFHAEFFPKPDPELRKLVKPIDFHVPARPVQSTASDVMPPREPWPGALSGMAPPWITDEPLTAEVAGAGETWPPPTPEVLYDMLLLVSEAPPRLNAIEQWTVKQRVEVETWVAAVVAAANDHEGVEIPPYPSILGPTQNGQPVPCGNCGKRGHVTGTCPELE